MDRLKEDRLSARVYILERNVKILEERIKVFEDKEKRLNELALEVTEALKEDVTKSQQNTWGKKC